MAVRARGQAELQTAQHHAGRVEARLQQALPVGGQFATVAEQFEYDYEKGFAGQGTNAAELVKHDLKF